MDRCSLRAKPGSEEARADEAAQAEKDLSSEKQERQPPEEEPVCGDQREDGEVSVASLPRSDAEEEDEVPEEDLLALHKDEP